MIQDIKPYPAYKDSCVPWLGDVPEHWRIQSLGSITTAKSKRGRPDLPLLSVVREKGVIPRASMLDEENHNFIPDDLSNYKVAEEGDLVINKMKAWQGSLGLAPMDGIVSPAYYVFDLQMEDKKFGQVLLRSRPYVGFFAQASDGVRVGQWDLSIDGMKRIPVVFPPADEQSAIVRFLDLSDRRIRRLIRVKRQMIGLLNEQKQGIIHQAVTRGLDPDVRLKSSGVEWLGDVPEHWEVWQVSHFAKVGNGSTPSRGNQAYWSEGNYPWLNSSCANLSYISGANQFVTDLALRECHLPKVQPGSVLVAITGQGKTRGKATVLGIEATINQHIAYITPRQEMVSAEYLSLFLFGAYSQLRAISDDSGSTKGALTCQDLKHFKVTLPPIAEQTRIVHAIQTMTSQLEAAIDRAQSEIDLIREYRTRLITDVVTGKLDVRGVAVEAVEEELEDLLDTDDTDSEEMGADEAEEE